MIRDAVILAAGKGTRLRTSDDDLPKPLHRVGGVPLIKRTILTLASAGVTRVVVVTGFMADQIRATVTGDPAYAAAGVAIELAHNEEFERSNGISVMVGGARVGGPFVLSMADHLYTAGIARQVGSADLTAADLYLATDTRIGDVLDLDDATKVRTAGGRILDIGKSIEVYDRIDCGVFAVTPRLLGALAEVRAERGDCSLSHGVKRLAEQGRARVVDIGDGYWQDVDTPADRAHAEEAIGRFEPLAPT
ncbi:MAG TPA: NTP transferase domain-containing protein [Kofleriaceae bacterium]|nr:NTP transferase domain-containing protein [Kofleriaceae bacterium]